MKRGIRTYGQLIAANKPSCQHGTCCACHQWNRPTWQLSTRASICKECAERKSGEVLGSIVTAERKAKRWVKNHPTVNAQFIAHLAGLEVEYVQSLIDARDATKATA